MNTILKTLLQPVANRHYTSAKASAILYASQYIPAVILCIIGALFVNPYFIVALLGIIAFGIIDYILFDALIDKLSWKFFWSRFYKSATVTPEQQLMKAYEQDPSPKNHQALLNHLNHK